MRAVKPETSAKSTAAENRSAVGDVGGVGSVTKRRATRGGCPPGSVPISDFRTLVSPHDRYWADPFLVSRDGSHFIFVEDFRYADRKGRISVLEFKDGKIRDYQEIIDTPYHLSFPFIFEHDENLYMIPESSQNNSIDVWSCEKFPYSWRKSHVLMDNVAAVDTVLFEDGNTWWMFTNLRRIKQENLAELHIFYSDHPLSSEWRPHPLNPVVREARNARMAGRVFRTNDGRIIRCAQDNRFRYGYGIVFCEVTCLTQDSYDERIVEELKPLWDRNVVGCHHLDGNSKLTVIDAEFRSVRMTRW